MKYTINVKPVVYWEGLNVELETTADETEVLGKVTKEIYSAMMEALKPMIAAETGMTIPTPTCTCQSTCTSSESTNTSSFKEVEEEKSEEPKPAKKEKEKKVADE